MPILSVICFDLVCGVIFVENGLVLLLGSHDNAVGGFNPYRGCPGRHGGQGVLNLDELAGGAAIKNNI